MPGPGERPLLEFPPDLGTLSTMVRLSACAVLALVACHPGSDDSFPIVPQGDDTVITPAPDAPPSDAFGDAAVGITGRVCVVSDLRSLASGCATNLMGITVTLGTESTTTLADGSFTLTIPNGEMPGPLWTASGVGFMTSNVKAGGPNLIPMVSTTRYDEVLGSNGMALAGGEGSIIARVVRAGAALPGITATTNPAARYVTHYDGATALDWDQGATGSTAVLWVPGVGVGNVTVTLAPGSIPPIVLPVADQAITFATFDIP